MQLPLLENTPDDNRKPKFRLLRQYKLNFTLTKVAEIPSTKLESSRECAEVLHAIHSQVGDNLCEYFYVLFLNRGSRIMGYAQISKGGITGTVADPRIICLYAMQVGCTSLILAHNHPSGQCKPSRPDEELTMKIREAMKYLDVKVLDHIILSDDQANYYSFADEGIL